MIFYTRCNHRIPIQINDDISFHGEQVDLHGPHTWKKWIRRGNTHQYQGHDTAPIHPRSWCKLGPLLLPSSQGDILSHRHIYRCSKLHECRETSITYQHHPSRGGSNQFHTESARPNIRISINSVCPKCIRTTGQSHFIAQSKHHSYQ
jgi:hypothetical protein